MGPGRQHPGHDHAVEALADPLDALDDQPQPGQRGGEVVDVGGEGREVTKPGKGDAHLELLEEADVVGDEVADVVDVVADHGAAVDAEAEGEARPLLGVDADGLEHVGVDHPAAAQLDPARLRAHPAALALAEDAGDLELGRRLGEREERRPQPGVDVGAEVGVGERLDGAGQVAEGDAPVDDQPLDLVEDGQVAGVGRVPAVGPAGGDDVDRRRLRRHHPDLHGRGVGAQQRRLGLAQLHVEGVPHAAGRMGGGHVEGLEVVPVGLDLGPLGHRVAHADEDVLQLAAGLVDEVEVAAASPAPPPR